MRKLLAAIPLVLLSCKTSPEPAPQQKPAEPPKTATATTAAEATPPAAQETPKPAQALVDPDVRTPEQLAREKAMTAEATAVNDAFSNGSPALSPDGKRLVFRSNRDGLAQLYAADATKPSAAPVRLTKTTERTVTPQFTPDGKSVLFMSDTGADENFSIFSVPAEGGEPVELTQGEKLQRDDPILPEKTPGTLFFSARSVKEKLTRIYSLEYGKQGELPKLLFNLDVPGGLTDVSPDGKHAVLMGFVSPSETYLMRVDLGSGEAKRFYPAEGKAERVYDAKFSPDGAQVIVATDGGGEQSMLFALDAASGEEKARWSVDKPATAVGRNIEVSSRSPVIAVDVDAGDHAEIRFLDAKTLKPTVKAALPLGSGGAESFSFDGKRLLVNWSTPATPWDVYAVDPKTGKSTPLRADARPTVASLPKLDTQQTTVTTFDGKKVPVNLYLPAKGGKKGPFPVIVSVHGGPAASSAVGWSPFVRFFVARGYAIVEPNIRGSTGFGRAYEMADNGPKRLEALQDLEAVANWTATQPWADPKRLIVYGGSYGGYMVLMAVTRQTDLWRAGVDLVGPSSWRSFMASTSGLIREILSKEFGSVEKDGAFLDSISPLADADKITAPLFVYQGQNDPRVPRAESDQIVAALRKRAVPVEYMIAANEGHSLDRRENRIEMFVRVARFLDEHVK